MMKKIFTILLAVALVLSFSVVATPVSADVAYAELTANITAPMEHDNIMGGAEFPVTANVTNNGTTYALNVTATIQIISGNAILQTGQAATKNVDTELTVNETRAVNWTLVCTGGGAVNITVTPSGTDGTSHNPIGGNLLHPDTVNITQEKVLQVTIVAPPNLTAFNVTQQFNVTAKVTNNSSLNATDVKLKITIDRYAGLKAGENPTWEWGPLASNATSDNHTWTLNCTGDGFSRITVTPSGKVGNKDIPADALTADTVTVSQGDFKGGNITLVKGWNLISLPLIPLDSDINVVLAGLDDVISVWYWDVEIKDWRSFAPGGAPHNLLTMTDGKAYWINMKSARTLNLAGTDMPKGHGLPPAYDVVVGWNMVGFKSTATNVTAADYLAGTEYVRIYWFEYGTWFLIPGPSYNTTTMVPGRGYWVAFTAPGTIYP
jgi:nitrogen fixation protein